MDREPGRRRRLSGILGTKIGIQTYATDDDRDAAMAYLP